jgi:hypothetical protein
VVQVLLSVEEEAIDAVVISSFSRSIPANALKAAVPARQREQ